MIFRGTLRRPALLALLVLLTQGCWSKPVVVSFFANVPKPVEQSPALETATEPATVLSGEEAAPAEAAATASETPAATQPQAIEGVRRFEAMFPESRLAAPDKDLAGAGTKYDTRVLSRTVGAPLFLAWQYRQDPAGMIVGFDFSNRGGNRILPERYNIDKNLFFTRDFQFRFDDRARQDIHLSVTDWTASRDRQFRLSELMNSVLHFFPRKYVPAIAAVGDRSIVTLPTGERVEFDAETHEVLSGALAEAPVDLNPDRTKRHFAGIDYVGKGLVVRADARGTDPRLGTTATIVASEPGCAGGGCKKLCRVASKELWEQKGAVRFKFATDEEFDRYLQSRCGFGIPRGDDDTVAALY
jgi:hypothetical protein